MNDLQKTVQAIQEKQSFVFITHLNPDGDGLGSELALAPVLRRLGKHVTIANSGGIPVLYRFLPGWETVGNAVSPDAHFDAAIIFECPSRDRAGKVVDLDRQAGMVINIDHHHDNAMYGQINWVDTEAAAVGEQI